METKSEVPVEDGKSITQYLSANAATTLDHQLLKIYPKLNIDRDARAHSILRPELMVIRQELRDAKTQTLAGRRVALRKQLLEDFMQEDRELRSIGLAYARPGP